MVPLLRKHGEKQLGEAVCHFLSLEHSFHERAPSPETCCIKTGFEQDLDMVSPSPSHRQLSSSAMLSPSISVPTRASSPSMAPGTPDWRISTLTSWPSSLAPSCLPESKVYYVLLKEASAYDKGASRF